MDFCCQENNIFWEQIAKNSNSVENFKIKLDDFRNNTKKNNLRENFGELLDDLREFDIHIDNVLNVYNLCKVSF